MKYELESRKASIIPVSSRPEASPDMVGPPETVVFENKKSFAFQTLNFKISLRAPPGASLGGRNFKFSATAFKNLRDPSYKFIV